MTNVSAPGLSMIALEEMLRRNLAILRTTWNAQEKESARLVARITAEMIAERIRDY